MLRFMRTFKKFFDQTNPKRVRADNEARKLDENIDSRFRVVEVSESDSNMD